MEAVSHKGPRMAASLQLLGWVETELARLCSTTRVLGTQGSRCSGSRHVLVHC